MVSGGLAYAGKQAAIANSFMRGAGSAAAGRIGIYALTASTMYDAAKTMVVFHGCLTGQGGK
ncbi:hypothetical protein IP65_16510 [Novosphingobium sp. AAP1]|nr:hypothetical protein IP65_16510 [Novosphingobium sp. AAP1]